MKKLNLFVLTTILFAISILSSCVKDTGKKTYQVYTPIIETTSSMRAKVKSETAKPVSKAGKLLTIGNYIFLNDKGTGIHVFDNTNPSNPINLSFINIPGNYDVAVKGNILYADCYTDIIALDISNPSNIVFKNYVDDVFKDIRVVNGFTCSIGNVITGFTVKEATMDITIQEGQGIWKNNSYISNNSTWDLGGFGAVLSSSNSSGNVSIGKAGSMSRFAIINNFMYAVSNANLNTINISNTSNPSLSNTKNIGWNIETIYPFKDKLFIGSQTGMMIYDISNPTNANYVSGFSHARLCDPVITDGSYAYITLHSSADICAGTQNEVNVVDVSNMSSPTLVTRMNLTKPHGLDKDADLLFICDDDAGIKVIDATNPKNISIKSTLPLLGTYDIICNNGLAIVSAKGGIHQYDYSNPNNIVKLSSINY